jgi:DNA repair protein RecO (recombination protein O)
MISTKAFVLRAFKHSESDLIVSFLTSEGQKLKLYARGAMKSRKRFGGGVLEPMHFVSIQYKDSKSEQLGQLQEAGIIESFESIRRDYDRIQMGLHFISLVDRLGLEGVDDGKPLFDLLGNALSGLQVVTDLNMIKTQFELKLLHLQGVLPAIAGIEPMLNTSIRESQNVQLDTDTYRRLKIEAESLLRQYLS